MNLQEIKTAVENETRIFYKKNPLAYLIIDGTQYYVKTGTVRTSFDLEWFSIERLASELHNFSTSCKLSQIEYFRKIYAIGINTVTCGNCGGVLFHSIGQEGYLTCPHCQTVSDPCDFPDFF